MIDDKGAFGRLLRQRRHFRRLWYSNMISLLGDWLSYVAVSLVAINQGGSALSVAIVLVAHTLPMALVAPLTGPLADRIDRRTLMIAAHLLAAGLTVAMWGAAEAGAIAIMQLLLLLRVAASGMSMTARLAAVPQLVEKDELHAANALLGLTWSLMFTAGVAAGGIIAALLGPGEAILLDAATFLVSASIVATLPALPPSPDPDAPPRPGLRDLTAGWRYARPRPALMASLLAKVPPSSATAGGWVTLNLVAGPRMAGSIALGLGAMHAIRAVGTGIGPLLPRHWIPRESNLGTPLVFIGVALFLAFDSPWVFLPALVIWGMGSGHNWVTSTAELQSKTPGPLLGRMSALNMMGVQVTQPLMAVVAALIIDATGGATSGAWIAVGVGVIAWAWLMVIRKRPDTV